MNVCRFTKEHTELLERIGVDVNVEETIQGLVNWIILSLYRLDDELVFKVDKKRLIEAGVDVEPINWGDLKCYYVEKKGETYIAFVDEASPDCVKFRRFIEERLKKWGWDNVVVETEW